MDPTLPFFEFRSRVRVDGRDATIAGYPANMDATVFVDFDDGQQMVRPRSPTSTSSFSSIPSELKRLPQIQVPLSIVERLDEPPPAAHDWQIIVDVSNGALPRDAPVPSYQDNGAGVGLSSGTMFHIAAGPPASPLNHSSGETTSCELQTAEALSSQLLSSCAGSGANSLAGEVSFPASTDASPARDVSNAKRLQSPTPGTQSQPRKRPMLEQLPTSGQPRMRNNDASSSEGSGDEQGPSSDPGNEVADQRGFVPIPFQRER